MAYISSKIGKHLCWIGIVLFILGFIFIIISFSKLEKINPITNTTSNNNLTIITGWGLLLLSISIFITTCVYVYMCRNTTEPLLNNKIIINSPNDF